MRRQHFGVAAMVSMIAATQFNPPNAHAGEAPRSNLHIDEIVITASPLLRDRFDVVQGTSVLTGDRLAAALRPSIGETLANEPGVTSTFSVLMPVGRSSAASTATGYGSSSTASAASTHLP